MKFIKISNVLFFIVITPLMAFGQQNPYWQTHSLQNNALSLDKNLTIINETTQDFALDNYFVDLHLKFRDDIWNSADKLKMAGNFERILDWKQVYNMNENGFFSHLHLESTSVINTLNHLEGLE